MWTPRRRTLRLQMGEGVRVTRIEPKHRAKALIARCPKCGLRWTFSPALLVEAMAPGVTIRCRYCDVELDTLNHRESPNVWIENRRSQNEKGNGNQV